MEKRMQALQETAVRVQQDAIRCWNEEIGRRFSDSERQRNIYEVKLA
jgi:hypothetical protein